MAVGCIQVDYIVVGFVAIIDIQITEIKSFTFKVYIKVNLVYTSEPFS